MILTLAQQADAADGTVMMIITSLFIAFGVIVAVVIGLNPLLELIDRQEQRYDLILRRRLLYTIPPRAVTVITIFVVVMMGLIGYAVTTSVWGMLLAAGASLFLPGFVIKKLRKRRVNKLEEQLVPGIQTLASAVRAGLNLVQAMQLVARDGPRPLREEFQHLLREYEFGVPLDEAMDNASDRIGSGDFKLLFAALHTHRERGGNLGETLDRISDSIREIQRLEKRVETLTAQGRVTARWLAAMPAIVLGLLYLFVNADGVRMLFIDDLGKIILAFIILLNILGFIWIKKIVAVDI
ncbi:MAG: type II secretion system F family protein [Phycisphaerae bacterium]